MYKQPSILYECQDLRYEKDSTSPSSTSIISFPSQSTSLLNSSDLSGLDFVKFVHPGNFLKPDINSNRLSEDENVLLLKAEKKENDHYKELQMTTLMNSRYIDAPQYDTIN